MVKRGDTVRINYTGRLEDGTVFDASTEGHPLEFVVGEGEVIPGLEDGVVGMTLGEVKSIFVPMEEGYGPHSDERVFNFDRKRIPENFDPEIGQQIQMYRADGLPMMVTIVGVKEDFLTLDCNHPLSGKALIFDTKLVEIL